MNPVDFAIGLTVGLLLAAALYLLLSWYGRRPVSAIDPEPGRPSRESGPPYPPTGRSPQDGASGAGVDTTVAEGMPPGESAAGRIPEVARPATEVPTTTPPETLRLSHRLILHVHSQGIRPPSEIAPFALCQAGMVEAMGVPQAGLAAVLRRLEGAGILVGERAHVVGRDRRLKVYRLSSRGIELARELRLNSRGRPASTARRPRPRSADAPVATREVFAPP
ncbi:MAG TPA: hypothetical protein VN864_08110 [Thermoplasmata archaeon]|nr:hypothetical protein [Thermoplasmata archaeon]